MQKKQFEIGNFREKHSATAEEAQHNYDGAFTAPNSKPSEAGMWMTKFPRPACGRQAEGG
jgi:hypothetical protein